MDTKTSFYKSHIAENRTKFFVPKSLQTSALAAVYSYTNFIDTTLQQIVADVVSPATAQSICLIALGGYGRRELCPYSDIDLLILHGPKVSKEELGILVRFLWDIGLSMGCVTRTIDNCRKIAGEDLATDLAYCESRPISGNYKLHEVLKHNVIAPCLKRKKKEYMHQLRTILHTSLFSTENSMFRLEPELKNGVCTLRDCHRVLWIENINSGIINFSDLHTLLNFPKQHVENFISTYSFLMGIRCALHMVCNRRIDILETALQPGVAHFLGMRMGATSKDGNPGMLMEQFFKNCRSIRQFLLLYLEKKPGTKNVLSGFHKRITAVEAVPGIFVFQGLFFIFKEKVALVDSAELILTIFRQAVIHQASFSVELHNKIRMAGEHLPVSAFHEEKPITLFCEILKSRNKIGHILILMHEIGVLAKIIPQFEALTCKVEYDSYHEFCVDQHILLAVAAVDDLHHSADLLIKKIQNSLKRPWILRLALLLHDIGKGQPGDHSYTGAVIAETICERLGLTIQEVADVRTLVNYHLSLSQLSFELCAEQHMIHELSTKLGTTEMLDMLFLLTCIDIKWVGQNTWTGWKGHVLGELYKKLHTVLTQTGLPQSAALSFSYQNDTTSKEQELHTQLLEQTQKADIVIHQEIFNGFEQLTLAGTDRIGFLSDIIGCISSEGYNIRNARIYSLPNNHIIDIFTVEPPDAPIIYPALRTKSILVKWQLLMAKKTTTDQLVVERMTRYPLHNLRQQLSKPQVDVVVDNQISAYWTSIRITTHDNFGLVHRIVHCLSNHGVNINAARLSTRTDLADDIFYVSDQYGQKIDDPKELKILTEDLKVSLIV